MKNWIKKIGQNKFQFFFFVGVLAILVVALVISVALDNQSTEPSDNLPPVIVQPNDDEEPVVTTPEEVLKLPFSETLDYAVVRKFYDKNASKEDQMKSLIKYGNTYRTSSGTGFAAKDNTPFDVTAALSGEVIEIKESPLYGNYVVVKHSDDLKTCYYGLSEVTTSVGTKLNQGDKIGVSGATDIDKEAGNHVYFQVQKNNKYVNPEVLIGKKKSEI